jgi:hypothetical protein
VIEDDFQFAQVVAQVSDDLNLQLNLDPQNTEQVEHTDEDEDEDEEGDDEDDDGDFSFMFAGSDSSAITADDVFHDGQIKPVFPLFNRDLLLADYNYDKLNGEFPSRSPVKVFVEAPPHPSSSSDKIDGVPEGPYCNLSDKGTEEGWKKSNSTGFSKLWRFKDYLDRSNSDGRDAFVMMDKSAVRQKREKKVAETESSSDKKPESEISSEKKVKVVKKGKKAALSAHEVYMRSRGTREEEKRRTSYLPYRPVVGFFTNVSGGMSRNVHPF